MSEAEGRLEETLRALVGFDTTSRLPNKQLIDWMERRPHGYVRPRDAQPETAPYHAWEKKMMVLMNEHSFHPATPSRKPARSKYM